MDGTATSRAIVLVVEDDEHLRGALMHGLEAEGFAVETVSSAADAYERVSADRPDIVLLDWWLGEGEMGASVCRRLSEDCGLRVVMHTGLSDARDRAAAYRAGAVGFIEKGTPLEDLAACLRRLIDAPD